MLRIECDFCSDELKELGALLFGPPTEDRVRKLHMCRKCYHRICETENITKIPNYPLDKRTICDSKPKDSEQKFC